MTNRTKTPQSELIEHLRELNRRTDELYDFHLPYMHWCGRIHQDIDKLDFDTRWEIGRFEYEIRYSEWYNQDFAAKQAKAAAKRARTIARKKLELAEQGK